MNRISLSSVLLALATAAAVLTPACSSAPLNLSASNRVPAAEGTVKAAEAKNGNTSIALKVKTLAPPQKVDAAATTYVVWARPLAAVRTPAGNMERLTVNLGALKVDQSLNGSLETVTPFREFELFVTAEPSATVTAPSNQALLWTTVKR